MRGQRVRGLDGLRALSALTVFAAHKIHWANAVGLGGTGVRVFFVISGFLIISILRGQRERIEQGSNFRSEWLVFMLHRSFRVFPIYYAVILIMFLIIHYSIKDLALLVFYISNLPTIIPPYHYTSFGGHLWSLAVEEQFYLIACPIFLIVPSRHTLHACIAVAIIALFSSLGFLAAGEPRIFFYGAPVANFGLMALGGVAALWPLLQRLPKWSASASLAAYVGLNALAAAHFHTPLYDTIVWTSPVLIALSLTGVRAHQSSLIVRVLDCWPLRRLGRISYCFYLIHPFIDISSLGLHAPHFVSVALDFVVTTAILAISWKIFEIPIQKLGRRLASAYGKSNEQRFVVVPSTV